MRHICITETCLRMLTGKGTATVRKKHHTQFDWSPIDAQPTYPTLKEFPGQLPQPQCHPVGTYGL